MPSPFPGMDPYLEAPDLWPGFHQRFATELCAELNRILPAPYYADLEVRAELGIVMGGPGRPRQVLVPDVTVAREHRAEARAAPIAVLDEPRRQVSPAVEFAAAPEAPRHPVVEIRDPRRAHALVTLVEILSPSNKRPGPDRESYAAKQRQILNSEANLIEVDLLRSGQRVLPTPELETAIDQIDSPSTYLVLVSYAWRRTTEYLGYIVYPFTLREWLPCIGVPLRREEPEIPLDLQYVFGRAYDSGPYRRGAVDYTRPPDPPLTGDDAAWAAALLREQGLAAPEA